jgi:hypothetical protein
LTTISPYLFFWQASQEVEEVHNHHGEKPLKQAPAQVGEQLQRIRLDTYVGMAFSNFVAFFIILTAASTLHVHGITEISTSAQAAKALEPVAGRFAFLLFVCGIVSTGLLAVPVLAASACYGIGEACRWKTSLERKPHEAVRFYAAIVAAKLAANQDKVAKQAHIILNASAKAGIKGLVYALAGYDATKEEVIAAFVQEEARDYEKEFPDQLYEEWYRLYQLPKTERNKPWKFMHLTAGQVYKPLAKSNGKVLDLTKTQRESSNARWKKLHQGLSGIGVKALRTHLGQLLGIAKISNSREEYERFFEKIFGEQRKLFD